MMIVRTAFQTFSDAQLACSAGAQVDIAIPEVFVGGMLGAMLVFLFASWACVAVGRTAQEVVNEVSGGPLLLVGEELDLLSVVRSLLPKQHSRKTESSRAHHA